MRIIRTLASAGTKVPAVAIAVTACLAAGAAAAAAGHDGPLFHAELIAASSEPITVPVTEPATTVPATEPAATEPIVDTTPLPTDTAPAAPVVADAPTTVATEPAPVVTDPPVSIEEPAPASTQPAAPPAEPPATAPASTEPATTAPAAPPTTVREDTKVPEGIALTCAAAGADVTCEWSGGVVDGFGKFLLLRGDGGPKGRVPFMSSDPSANGYIDHAVPAGSYSYVVVTIDANSHTLVHSNPVFLTIGAAG